MCLRSFYFRSYVPLLCSTSSFVFILESDIIPQDKAFVEPTNKQTKHVLKKCTRFQKVSSFFYEKDNQLPPTPELQVWTRKLSSPEVSGRRRREPHLTIVEQALV